ncbi:hypothetical protein [Bradyrhizobium genosp. P]|uniref:hypothetical protein n=1 Tax=Bradyrhizobium genosp. P TaxID=83641 RepID=UPI003CFAA909
MRSTDSLLLENGGATTVLSMGAPVIVIQKDCVAYDRPATTADTDKPSINESKCGYSSAAGLQQQKVRRRHHSPERFAKYNFK